METSFSIYHLTTIQAIGKYYVCINNENVYQLSTLLAIKPYNLYYSQEVCI